MTRQKWSDITRSGVEFRRHLHQNPELTWQEHETAREIRDRLTSLEIPWRPCAETGTIASLATGRPGRHIALRGDMDALPILEKNNFDHHSRNKGVMHACGHDGHTATLFTAAAWLKSHEDLLPGPVSLLFQPAEEGGHGAAKMIAEGALEGVDMIFGWHNWPAIPFGRAVCPDGVVMAGNGTFHIDLVGKGGHASQPEICRDPLLAAAALTLNLQQIVSRRLAPQEAGVVSVTSIDGKSGVTTIQDRVRLEGSIRVTDRATKEKMNQWITEIARETAAVYGVKAEVEIRPRYNPTVNHPEAARVFREILSLELGEDWRDEKIATPIMASEDFSYYLEKVPGAFALVGNARPDGGLAVACHNPEYEFNDDLIPLVARMYLRLAGLEEIPAD